METVAEAWIEIPEEPYEVSNHGRVRSVPHEQVFVTGFGECRRTFPGRILKLILHRGYHIVNLSRGKKRRQRPVHQLVARAFIGERPEGLAINHINGIKTDNRPENLEYISNRENVLHAYRTGLLKNHGEHSGRAVLSDDSVREIRSLRGTVAPKELARRFGVSTTHIHRVWKNIVWSHVT